VRYAAGLFALASSAVSANATDPVRWQLNLIPGVTATSHNAYNAHMIMLWICVVIGIGVFGAMGYAMFKFRKSKGAVPDTKFTHSTVLEAIWTVVPIVILIGSAIPATRMVVEQYNADHNAKPAEMTIKVTGYQWMWRYEYIGPGRELHQPPGSRIRPHTPGRQHARREARSALPARRRPSPGAAGRHPHPLRDHRRRRDPRLVGSGPGLEAGRDSGRHQTRPGRK